MKELNNNKYLIRDDINSSIISLWQTDRPTDRHKIDILQKVRYDM